MTIRFPGNSLLSKFVSQATCCYPNTRSCDPNTICCHRRTESWPLQSLQLSTYLAIPSTSWSHTWEMIGKFNSDCLSFAFFVCVSSAWKKRVSCCTVVCCLYSCAGLQRYLTLLANTVLRIRNLIIVKRPPPNPKFLRVNPSFSVFLKFFAPRPVFRT